ncbi:Mechanosensitive ion channel-domain-containing protein [Abortiporus biennis]|nr:Mechanosensitive ion channel-domain-containing protein [Abortiporus biennis]
MSREPPNPQQSGYSHEQTHSQSTSAPRPRHIAFFNEDDIIDEPLPSPPYQRVASTSHFQLNDYPEQSPAYKSRSNLDLAADMVDVPLDRKEEPEPDYEQKTSAKPSVHYPEDVHSPPVSNVRPMSFFRADSDFEGAGSGSRTPSIAGTDDEYDEDDYDWSNEDDLVDEEAKFEHAMGRKRKSPSRFKRFITLLFSSLIGSTFISAVIITPAILIHFFWYKRDPTDHRRFVKDNVQAWLFWAAANISISWFLALLIDFLPPIIRYFIALSWGHVSEAIKTKLELYNSVKDTIKPLFYAASGWVSWVILFEHIYKLYNQDDPGNSRARYTERIYQVIEFLFFFSLVICAQRMLSHAVAFSFHRTAYKERLQSVTEVLNVVEKLRNYRRKKSHYPKSSLGFGRSTPALSALAMSAFTDKDVYVLNSRRGTPANSRPGTPERLGQDICSGDEGDVDDPDATLVKHKKDKGKRKSWFGEDGGTTDPESVKRIDHHYNGKHSYPPSNSNSPIRTGASTPERGSGTEDAAAMVQQAATQAAKVLKSAVLHDARNLQGNVDDELGSLVFNVSSAAEAKKLARSIWNQLRDRHRSYLIEEDFYPAFKTREEATAAFRVFDKDNNKDLTKPELKTVILKVYKERRILSRSMRDVGMALTTLDHILLFFALVILFFISLSVFNVDVGDSLTSVYSLGIAASFIFKNSASNAFDAIMFLFVTHPFDTGDRCFIDEENLKVKKMGLFATIFTRADGTETYYFNSMLFTKFIINARRSAKTAENLTMQVAWRTPLEKLDALEKCLNEWLATEENRWYEPNTSVTLQKINYQRHLELTIGIPHNSNWQDWDLKLRRKTAFHAAVNYFCRQLGIIAHEAPMPIAYADHETMDYMPMTPTPIDEDSFPSPEPEQTGYHRDGTKAIYLGFAPPSDKPVPGIRARKSKGRKNILRTMGADG